MTTEKITTAKRPQHLYLDSPKEAREVFRANGRYGTSWFYGEEAAEQSIELANRIKSWLGNSGVQGVVEPLVFVGGEVDYVMANLEAMRDNVTDSHNHAARTIIESIVYIDAALPLATQQSPARLTRAS